MNEEFELELETMDTDSGGGMMWLTRNPPEEPESSLVAFLFELGHTVIFSVDENGADPEPIPMLMVQYSGMCGSGHEHIQRLLIPAESVRGFKELIEKALETYNL